MLTHDEVKQSADFLRGKLPFIPEIGIVLGSGLGPLAEEIEQPVCIPYGDILHFRVSTAPDHAGRLVCGTLSGRRVVCMQGRLHGASRAAAVRMRISMIFCFLFMRFTSDLSRSVRLIIQ